MAKNLVSIGAVSAAALAATACGEAGPELLGGAETTGGFDFAWADDTRGYHSKIGANAVYAFDIADIELDGSITDMTADAAFWDASIAGGDDGSYCYNGATFGDYVYCVGQKSNAGYGQIVQFNKDDLSEKKRLELTDLTAGIVYAPPVEHADGTIMVADQQGNVATVNPNALTKIEGKNVATTFDVESLTSDGTYAYHLDAAAAAEPIVLRKISFDLTAAVCTYTGSTDLLGDGSNKLQKQAYFAALAGGSIFCVGYTNPAWISKIDTSTLELVSAFVDVDNDYDSDYVGLATDGMYLYVGTAGSTPSVVTYDASDIAAGPIGSTDYSDLAGGFWTGGYFTGSGLNAFVMASMCNTAGVGTTFPNTCVMVFQGNCDVHCSANADAAPAAADPTLCECTCHLGFNGTVCDECAEYYWGYPDCVPMPCNSTEDCSGHAASVEGNKTDECVCTCNAGFNGTVCDACADGYELYPACTVIPESSSSSSSEATSALRSMSTSSSAAAPLVAGAWALLGAVAALIAA